MNTKLLTLLYCLTFWQVSVLVPRSPTPRVSRIIRLLLWMTRSVRWFLFKPWITLAKFSVIVWEKKKILNVLLSFFFQSRVSWPFLSSCPCLHEFHQQNLNSSLFYSQKCYVVIYMLVSLSLVSSSVLYFCCFFRKSLRLSTAGDVTLQDACIYIYLCLYTQTHT